MTPDPLNPLRWRAILQARAFREVFGVAGALTRSQEAVLAYLREYCFAQKTTFHRDALVMAKREGRREVWMIVTQFLNLDEDAVQQMMEIDDGLGE